MLVRPGSAVPVRSFRFRKRGLSWALADSEERPPSVPPASEERPSLVLSASEERPKFGPVGTEREAIIGPFGVGREAEALVLPLPEERP